MDRELRAGKFHQRKIAVTGSQQFTLGLAACQTNTLFVKWHMVAHRTASSDSF